MAESEQKYDVLEKIGHGSFGIIRKVRRRTDGMVLCRKEISYLKMSQKEREQLHAEFQILSTLRHVNIVGYYHREHLKATQDLHLYMEYCGNGDLGRVIRDLNQKNQFAEESFVWSIFAQLVTALYRCHYGVDPPEVGKNVLGLGITAKPKVPTGGVTILHRDLKPENVFLGEDNSVKLGDFGLAKMIQSHDFASTYVGTPFYMSPEICAAEKYTLKSDIWSLGCIIYELCAREPPFNAKSHYQLVQKIKEGKLAPLPVVYSPELCAVVRDCLKVNPDRRPDTAMLLNLPVVRLMRKEKEVVELGRLLKTKEEQLNKRMRDLDRKTESDKVLLRQEIDATVRREWEVKARLEIDRLVNAELEQLQKRFEEEVGARVQKEMAAVQKQLASQHSTLGLNDDAAPLQMLQPPHLPPPSSLSSSSGGELSSSISKSDYLHSSIGDGDFPSTTDLTELSVDESFNQPSPTAAKVAAGVAVAPGTTAFMKKQGPLPQTRTPFGRAQTMFAGGAGTPMDVEMASPSPMAIASLSLSPRRNAATKVPTNNTGTIFNAPPAGLAAAAPDDPRWHGPREPSDNVSDWDSDDDIAIPSPTRMIKSRKNPFTANRKAQPPPFPPTQSTAQPRAGGLPTQKSAPIFNRAAAARPKGLEVNGAKTAAGSTADGGLRAALSGGALRDRCVSPSRRLSKIPSAANLGTAANNNNNDAHEGTRGLTRKPSFNRKENGETLPSTTQGAQVPTVAGLISKQKPGIRGRTLVELQQARAGGRPLVDGNNNNNNSNNNNGGGGNVSPRRPFREHALAANRGAFDAPAVWDPEQDEMPSPFLVRRKTIDISSGVKA
ncbi:g2-specific protein kinase [Niveomyces insectorum RCEF 264]|uniref:non-specific serine/threonine protein kinase n=1 Tax=Niveomyces insectorum RCEF 264 TaxID=1081102 RepID=A0A167UI91_9HYPO|nr:g2-specific protein kinase [Niveomyces insectorum RCEF 264]